MLERHTKKTKTGQNEKFAMLLEAFFVGNAGSRNNKASDIASALQQFDREMLIFF